MRLIVPLLCLQYKYTPVGPEGDSLDKLIIVDWSSDWAAHSNSEQNTE